MRPKYLTVHLAKLRFDQRNSDSVRALQERLNAVVAADLTVSGNYLKRTREAVRRWQRSTGDEEASGELDPRQFTQLFPSPPYRRIGGEEPGALGDAC
jgi:peptidoglycan hydrolase-like protein with peptidoglycan-binding domain